MCAHDFARAFGGKFLLRIEDIDGTRSRAEHVDAILEDMAWLGLQHDGEVVFQSGRVDSYAAALERLKAMGLVYRCWCTRSEIAEALKRQPVPHGPDGPVYPGTCRSRGDGQGDYCWRLDMAAAVEATYSPLPQAGGVGGGPDKSQMGTSPPPAPPASRRGELVWTDLAAGPQHADPGLFGDVVLWRKDAPASYHSPPRSTMRQTASAMSCAARIFLPTLRFTDCCRRCLACRSRYIGTTRCCSTTAAKSWPNRACRARFPNCGERGYPVSRWSDNCGRVRFRLELRCPAPR
jgi:hypothetical protein